MGYLSFRLYNLCYDTAYSFFGLTNIISVNGIYCNFLVPLLFICLVFFLLLIYWLDRAC